MFRFKAKSNLVLAVISLLALLAFLAVEHSKADLKQEFYYEKLAAARLAKKAAESIKANRLENGIFIDAINDPNQTALIGQEYSEITTDRGYIDAKLSSTNPNFAAVIVQLLKDAGVKSGDNVAVAMTGSLPGLNIAAMAAFETLKVNPVIITSVGSSNWGANDPFFTWLDMENVFIREHIFHQHSVAASIGGGADIGRGISPEGRRLIKNAIERNHLEFINEEHLEKSIARRMEIYQTTKRNKPVKAFINIGGGIASLGNPINGKLFPAGLTSNIPMGNFPMEGVMILMGQQKIPVIHLLNISQLLDKYGLPDSPVPLPEPGTGEIFVKKKYNMLVTSVATFVMVFVLTIVFMSDRKHHRLGTDVVPPHKISKPTDNDSENLLI